MAVDQVTDVSRQEEDDHNSYQFRTLYWSATIPGLLEALNATLWPPQPVGLLERLAERHTQVMKGVYPSRITRPSNLQEANRTPP
jgi:hypothetical protein